MGKRKPVFYPFIFWGVLILSVRTSYAQFTEDAIILTLRQQYEDRSGIWLDSTLAAEIDYVLTWARIEFDTLDTIHTFPDYQLYNLIVATNASWNESWHQGQLLTGDTFIDSLGTAFGLIEVGGGVLNSFLLAFSSPHEMWQLSELYELHPEVSYSEPNLTLGDGDNIEHFKKDGLHHFAFSRGWGDCPAGCINRYYWYVLVRETDFEPDVILEEERYRDFEVPYIYRWNIPPRYAMTMFENADSVLSAITSDSLWWVRRHAIEGTWRFFVRTYPWVNEDIGDHWYVLQGQLISRQDQVEAALQVALSDPDLDVRASAEHALNEILAVGTKLGPIPSAFLLHEPYPNPFNPTTTIEFSVPQTGLVTLTVYDLLGREVETILNRHMSPGHHKVQWNATNVSSGIYFVKMRAGDFIKTRKVTVLR